MVVGRPAVLAALTLVALAGCAAGRQGILAKPEAPIVQSKATVASIVARHNKNASGVRSLTATPGIEVAEGKHSGYVEGRLNLEREKNFRLTLTAGPTKSNVADIGSNDQGFWFWAKDDKSKLLVCDYKNINNSPLSITLQPEWIVEAMGLREISEREAATINLSQKVDRPGMVILTQFRKDARGEALTKETIVDEASGHIVEHRLYSGAKKELLARATIAQYQKIKLPPSDDSSTETVVEVPARFKLEWFLADKFSLDVTMGVARINPEFNQDRRLSLFSEPTIRGAERIDIAQQQQQKPSPRSTARIHETMPQPSSGIRLGQPESIGVDGAYDNNNIKASNRLPPLPGDTTSASSESPSTVVTAPIPGGYAPRTASGPTRGLMTNDQ